MNSILTHEIIQSPIVSATVRKESTQVLPSNQVNKGVYPAYRELPYSKREVQDPVSDEIQVKSTKYLQLIKLRKGLIGHINQCNHFILKQLLLYTVVNKKSTEE